MANMFEIELARRQQSGNPFEMEIARRAAPPSPDAGMGQIESDRSVGEYLGETLGNIPESAGAVATDLWEAITSPIATGKAIGSAAVGGMQHAKDAMGIPTTNLWGNQRPAASAVADYYSDRYGGGQEFLDSLRTDPTGVALDIGGLVTGGAGTAARLPGTAGRLARAVMQADPVIAGSRAVGRGVDRGIGRAHDALRNRAPSSKSFIADAPTPGELQTQAATLFKAAEESGVRFKADYFDNFVDDIMAELVDEGADTILSPKVSRVADILEKSKGKSPSISEMSILRRQFGIAAGSADRAEVRLANIAIDRIDDFVEGGAGHVGGQLSEARSMWSRLKKSELLDTAIENAQTAQAGVEAGLRAEFKTLYRARNSRKMRGFTKAELAAIKAVAQGNFTSNTLRRIGALGGGSGPSRNMLNMMAGAGGGAMVGGPLGAVAVPLLGYGAGRAAQSMTQGRAALARAITAQGRTPGRSNLAIPPTHMVEDFARHYPPGAAPTLAPVAIGAERSDSRRRR